jgi:hypothetical protein
VEPEVGLALTSIPQMTTSGKVVVEKRFWVEHHTVYSIRLYTQRHDELQEKPPLLTSSG